MKICNASEKFVRETAPAECAYCERPGAARLYLAAKTKDGQPVFFTAHDNLCAGLFLAELFELDESITND